MRLKGPIKIFSGTKSHYLAEKYVRPWNVRWGE
jgi:hypothetical protein